MSYANLTPGPPVPAPRPSGIACPACAARRVVVYSTRQYPGRVVRVRVCRECGHRFRTAERVESTRQN